MLAFKLALVFSLIAATFALQPAKRASADCAFPFTPTTYEDLRDRSLYLNTIDLASFNMLFPGDPYFGLPEIEIGTRDDRITEPGRVPAAIMKAIAYIESSITQGDGATPYGSIGPSLVAFDCGHGIAQVTTGMTVPTGENGRGSQEQALVATHFAYNIARGAAILLDKWNEAPDEKPIVGTNTSGHPALLENWYYAIWSYNGFTGPGANKSNHPMDPIYGSWPRTSYSCGDIEDGLGHNRANYPYQELVIGCAANPPSIEGEQLWDATPISLPDLNDGFMRSALGLENFVFPYSSMDIPTPQPFHLDETEWPDPALRDTIVGSPNLAVNANDVYVGYATSLGSAIGYVEIYNAGSGVMSWYATPSEPWVTITAYTGVAAGLELPCDAEVPCDRIGRLEIGVDPALAPPGESTAQVKVEVLGSDQHALINVHVSEVIHTGVLND